MSKKETTYFWVMTGKENVGLTSEIRFCTRSGLVVNQPGATRSDMFEAIHKEFTKLTGMSDKFIIEFYSAESNESDAL